MSDTTLRYYETTMAFLPNRSRRRVAHARTLLRLTASRRKFKQSVRGMLSRVF